LRKQRLNGAAVFYAHFQGIGLDPRSSTDLPVEQPTKFELVVNLKSATAIARRREIANLIRIAHAL
jgi:hypothetical protein